MDENVNPACIKKKHDDDYRESSNDNSLENFDNYQNNSLNCKETQTLPTAWRFKAKKQSPFKKEMLKMLRESNAIARNTAKSLNTLALQSTQRTNDQKAFYSEFLALYENKVKHTDNNDNDNTENKDNKE